MYVIKSQLSQRFSLNFIVVNYLGKSSSQYFSQTSTNLCNLVRSLIRVSVLQLFPGMKNTHDSYYAAEKSVDRIKNMEPVQLAKMIQPGTELRKIIDQNNVRDASYQNDDF